MKSPLSLAVSMSLIFLVSAVGCGKKFLSSSHDGGMRAEALSDDSLIDELGAGSSFTTTQALYVAANSNIVTDIEEDNALVNNCELYLPIAENKMAAHWIPAGTTFPVVAAKIGTDRSFALATQGDGDPFDVPRLSCWTIPGDTQPLTISFLKAALAPSFSIDARH